MTKRRLFLLLWLAVVLAFLLRPSLSNLLSSPPAAPARQVLTPDMGALPSQAFLPTMGASAHSSNLALLNDGRLLATWFSGSREGADDVVIAASRFSQQGWEPGQVLINRALVSRATFSAIRKIGNPVVWRDPRSDLIHLFFVSVSLGGWATSHVNHSVSKDGGEHWSTPQRLYLSPVFNISTLVRSLPLEIEGGFALPVYHELARKYGALLWFDDDARLRSVSRIGLQTQVLQPAVVKDVAGHWHALFRNAVRRGENVGKLGYTDSADGQSWAPLRWLPIKNHDSSVALARLDNGELLMAYNDPAQSPNNSGRDVLMLATSEDGQHWQPRWQVEKEAGGEFSYPSLLAHNGVIDLSYTYQRQKIKHLRLSQAVLVKGSTPTANANATTDSSLPPRRTQDSTPSR